MRAEDLDHRALLDLDPEGGTIHFASQRAILLDSMAMGLLRKYLVENFGLAAARAVLTQFGFAHGWRMAEAMEGEFAWDSREEWRRAGTQIHHLEGLFRVAPGSRDPLDKAGLELLASYEAEQHLIHIGRAEAPACWTISGLFSGYLSRATGEEVFVLEDACLGAGDPACHFHGRRWEAWEEHHQEDLRFFKHSRLEEFLDTSLHQAAATLTEAEHKLREYHRTLIRGGTPLGEEYPLGIVARSPAMRQLMDLALRVAKVDSSVLITGESGSGKERIARLIHEESIRAPGPFIAVNCGAITETLLESELFGHARGAFTGAVQERAGLFEAANKGTLLLDEIGEISPGMQVKLLRVLQEREVRRVGENRARPVNVRVLSATNRDLAGMVARGAFRQDLYYRLRVIELQVPALRSRRDDILPLARVLLADAARGMGRAISRFSPAAADHLLRHPWLGNVRELANAMERAAALAPGDRVELEDLPEELQSMEGRPPADKAMVRPLEEFEQEYILAVLERNGGNQARTAEQLRIGTATLLRKLKSYGHGGSRKPRDTAK